MNELVALRRLPLLLPVLALSIVGVEAQTKTPPDGLSRTLASLDAALFDSAYRCELEKLGSFFADGVEFYHDQSGVTLGRQNVVESVKNNVCGKVRRELVKGTLQAFPMHGYGAVQMGVHRFHHPKAPSEPAGEARFIHLWQNKDGAWKITRVISYDHRALPR